MRERTTICEVGGITEYLLLALAFVGLCACAMVAYTGLDAIERDEEEQARWAKQQRALRPAVATLDAPVQPARPQPHWHGGSVTAHAEWLEKRVRGVEEQLDQLVRESERATRA